MTYEQSFIISLVITLLVEIPVVFLLVKYVYKKVDKKGIIFAGVVASALTLPYFWFILPFYISDRTAYIICGEFAIIVIEAFIYFKILKLNFKQALFVSLVANLVSTLIGLMVNN